MRQAGRYLPEYRALRRQYDLLTVSRMPELVAEIVSLPVRRFGFDAAILFGDIMLPVAPMGVAFTIEDQVGPIIASPLRARSDIARLRSVDVERDLGYVAQTMQASVAALDGMAPIIGFAGAPFTVASYLVEGRPSRDFRHTRALMFSDPVAWHDLMERLTRVTIDYLRLQIAAGADAVQLFDSWVGCLNAADYREFVLPYSRQVFDGLADCGVPRIHFGVGTSTLLEAMAEAGGEVMGVDWRMPLGEAWRRVGDGFAIQGNLDPARLLAPQPALETAMDEVLRQAARRPGHIFNLGHGILPDTPVENVEWLVAAVHERTARPAPAGVTA